MSTDDRDDATLVLLAGAGDAAAWDALTARFLPLVWAVVRSHRLDDGTSADVVQTTWLRLVENLDTLREPDRVRAWLVTVARRESLRELRRVGRVTPVAMVAEETTPTHELLEERALTEARDVDVRVAFGQLGERCRLLLTLVCAEPDLSYDEVSEELDMPIGSIGPTRARCLHKLRALLPARINES